MNVLCPRQVSVAASVPQRGAKFSAVSQGLTLVHFPTQLKRFVWDRGCIQGLFGGCLWGVRG